MNFSYKGRDTMRQKRRKRSYKRLWQAGILFMVILAAGLGLFFGKMQNGTLPGQDGDGKNRIVHVMILGVDRRADDAGRSDTMMIASLDPDKETASLLSVPRDTRVKIDGHGYEKINHAYAYGGHELSQKAVEQLLGEKIDHYILIDTRSFARIIDAMGGVDIQVEKRMYYEDPW
ncbi:MAG: LCP family protein, partial [Selenomonas montiformis]|nr:LCP family protein [Selenomonas montiformis]